MTWEKRIKQRFYRLITLALLAAAPLAASAQDPRERVHAVLEARGLGKDALGIVGNLLAHEGPPPPRTPAAVNDLLADPRAAADAGAIFARTVPGELVELAAMPPGTPSADFDALLERYIGELAEAQAELMAAVAPFDEPSLILALPTGIPLPLLATVADAVDAAALARARTLFLLATARFAHALRSPGLQFSAPLRFDSAIGAVVIGSSGPDRHAAGAALIIDPGGDDHYERAPASGGAFSVIIDLAGNDRYEGSDVAVRALSAIVDASGNDSYVSSAAGFGAAIAGISVLLDLDGDDQYDAGIFGQGAALFGLGALIDLRGNDRYRLTAFGQGYAGSGGLGLLWDAAGNDSYVGGGLPDPFQREGGIGFTQGAADGAREAFGGGIGILRDDAGDDRYESQMFAQGTGYYYALGMLWDRGGNDHYAAVRYAQGNGVHQAVGVLRDESGDDEYALRGGVGQGMGLDIAVGVLFDGAGDDRYRSDFVAQGSGTANGFGLLLDDAGTNEWQMGADPRSWGHAQWLRGLPTVGVLLHDPARSRFTRSGAPATPAAPRIEHEPEPPPATNDEDAARLRDHQACGARSLWMSKWASAEEARSALDSPCWRLQAAALERLKALGVAPNATASTPVFLRTR